MRGIKFIVDEDGRRRAVVLDLKVHGQLWRDISDRISGDEEDDRGPEPLDVEENDIIPEVEP